MDPSTLRKRKVVSLPEGDVSVSSSMSDENLALENYSSLKETTKRDLHRVLYLYLKARPRSRWECFQKLKENHFLLEEIEAELDFFEAQGWIGDRDFARWFLEGTQLHKARGYYGIRQKLREKHVQEDIINQVLEIHGEQFFIDAQNLLERESKRFAPFSGWKKRKKMYDYLYRRGFPSDDIERILESLEKS